MSIIIYIIVVLRMFTCRTLCIEDGKCTQVLRVGVKNLVRVLTPFDLDVSSFSSLISFLVHRNAATVDECCEACLALSSCLTDVVHFATGQDLSYQRHLYISIF